MFSLGEDREQTVQMLDVLLNEVLEGTQAQRICWKNLDRIEGNLVCGQVRNHDADALMQRAITRL